MASLKPLQSQLSPWGNGSIRSMYPPSFNGPYGSPGNSLPAYDLNSAFYGNPGYSGTGVYMNRQRLPRTPRNMAPMSLKYSINYPSVPVRLISIFEL